jgi:hypothetical protein
MELAISIHIEKLPEGLYLATSDELPGLVAQGRTVAEVLEIARDAARRAKVESVRLFLAGKTTAVTRSGSTSRRIDSYVPHHPGDLPEGTLRAIATSRH